MLFPGQRAGESDRGIEKMLSKRVVAVGFGRCADITVHPTSLHHDGDNPGKIEGPHLIVASDAEHEAAAACSTEEIAMEEEGPSAEHCLFGEPREVTERAVDEFFKAGVAGHFTKKLYAEHSDGDINRIFRG